LLSVLIHPDSLGVALVCQGFSFFQWEQEKCSGQAVSKGEKIETPTINPMQLYREKEAKREAQKEQDRLDTVLRNIERYDGTSNGQEDVRRY
jgi:hypothetical protein